MSDATRGPDRGFFVFSQSERLFCLLSSLCVGGEGVVVVESPSLSLPLFSFFFFLYPPRLGRNHKGHVYLKTQKHTSVLVLNHHHLLPPPPPSLPLQCEGGEAGKEVEGMQLGDRA